MSSLMGSTTPNLAKSLSRRLTRDPRWMPIIEAAVFASRDENRPVLQGICLDTGGRVVATDGHRLAQAKGSLKKSAAREVTAIVPTKLMALIQRLAADAEPTALACQRHRHSQGPAPHCG